MEVIKRSKLDRNGIPLPDARKFVTLLSEGLEEVQTPPIGIPNETQDRGLMVREESAIVRGMEITPPTR